MIQRVSLLAAMIAAASMTSHAHAGYTYSNTVTPSQSPSPSSGSMVNLTGNSSATTATGTTFMNMFGVTLITTTTPPASDSFSVNFSDMVQLSNSLPGSAGMGSIVVTGTIQFTRSDTGGEVSYFMLTSAPMQSTSVDGVTYTLSNFSYTPPTVNSSTGRGNVSALISSAAVPEPTSITMLGLGLTGVIGFARRRKLASV